MWQLTFDATGLLTTFLQSFGVWVTLESLIAGGIFAMYGRST